MELVNNQHVAELTVGSYHKIGEDDTIINITCNGKTGYELYAEGAGEGDNKTNLATSSGDKIATGTATSGDISSWHFKFSEPTGNLTIASGYDKVSAIPAESTMVASHEAGITKLTSDSVHVSYHAYLHATQAPGTYEGKVQYTLTQLAAQDTTTMQGFSCNLGDGESTTLTDTRDGNTYTVAKLKDGNCWMTRNLRIANVILTSADSDVSSDFALSDVTDSPNSSNSYTSTDVYLDRVYGGYYTWYGATAGEGTQEKSSGDTSQSICPKGWRLPTSAEYTALATAYGGDNSTGSAALQVTENPGFVYAGYYDGGSAYEQKSDGYYWSSTANSTAFAYYFYLNRTSAYSNRNHKRRLHSVRCVAR